MLDVVDIPGLYLYGASRDGQIWSKKTKGPNRLNAAKEWRLLKQATHHKTNYKYLSLQHNDKEKTFLGHYLIALTFLGPRPEGYEINHKDGNKSNNSIDNLEYITYLENLQHAWDNGLITVGKPKLTKEQVLEIRKYYALGVRQKTLSEEYKVNRTAISDIVNFVTYKHLKS